MKALLRSSPIGRIPLIILPFGKGGEPFDSLHEEEEEQERGPAHRIILPRPAEGEARTGSRQNSAHPKSSSRGGRNGSKTQTHEVAEVKKRGAEQQQEEEHPQRRPEEEEAQAAEAEATAVTTSTATSSNFRPSDAVILLSRRTPEDDAIRSTPTTTPSLTHSNQFNNAITPTRSSFISEIHIRSGKYLDSIQLVLLHHSSSFPSSTSTPNSNNTLVRKSKRYGGDGGQHQLPFFIPQNDCIIQVNVWKGLVVDAIQFVTYRGKKSDKFGGHGGTFHECHAPPPSSPPPSSYHGRRASAPGTGTTSSAVLKQGGGKEEELVVLLREEEEKENNMIMVMGLIGIHGRCGRVVDDIEFHWGLIPLRRGVKKSPSEYPDRGEDNDEKSSTSSAMMIPSSLEEDLEEQQGVDGRNRTDRTDGIVSAADHDNDRNNETIESVAALSANGSRPCPPRIHLTPTTSISEVINDYDVSSSPIQTEDVTMKNREGVVLLVDGIDVVVAGEEEEEKSHSSPLARATEHVGSILYHSENIRIGGDISHDAKGILVPSRSGDDDNGEDDGDYNTGIESDSEYEDDEEEEDDDGLVDEILQSDILSDDEEDDDDLLSLVSSVSSVSSFPSSLDDVNAAATATATASATEKRVEEEDIFALAVEDGNTDGEGGLSDVSDGGDEEVVATPSF